MTDKKKCPRIIYLQACDECYESASIDGEVTWCEDEINYAEDCCEGECKDTAYVRLDCVIEAVEKIKEEEKKNWDENDPEAASVAMGFEGANEIIREIIPEAHGTGDNADVPGD